VLGPTWPLPVGAQTPTPITLSTTPVGNVPDVVSTSTALQNAIQNGGDVTTAQTNYNNAVESAVRNGFGTPVSGSSMVSQPLVPTGQALVISANPGGSLLFSVPLSNTGGGFFLGAGNTVLPPLLGPNSPPPFTFSGLMGPLDPSSLGGGAIVNSGTATITNSGFENNTTASLYGGAIFNLGIATITNSGFENNTTASFLPGGEGALGRRSAAGEFPHAYGNR